MRLCAPLCAGAPTVSDLTAEFAAFVAIDFISLASSSSTGPIAAGGDVALNSFSLASALTPDSPQLAVLVGGDFAFYQGEITGGSAVVAGASSDVRMDIIDRLSGSQVLLDNMQLDQDFAQWRASFDAQAQVLSAAVPNGTAQLQ